MNTDDMIFDDDTWIFQICKISAFWWVFWAKRHKFYTLGRSRYNDIISQYTLMSCYWRCVIFFCLCQLEPLGKALVPLLQELQVAKCADLMCAEVCCWKISACNVR